jgi:hypothetical protein
MMDDQQLQTEDNLRKELRAAIGVLRAAIEAVNHGSSVTEIDLDAFEAFVHDEMPDDLGWDEKAHAAYREERWAAKGVRV